MPAFLCLFFTLVLLQRDDPATPGPVGLVPLHGLHNSGGGPGFLVPPHPSGVPGKSVRWGSGLGKGSREEMGRWGRSLVVVSSVLQLLDPLG